MRCEEFLRDYTEAFDGAGTSALSAQAQAHRELCPGCARYVRVVEEGCRLFRSIPPVEPSGRFRERLDHRLLSVDEDLRLLREGGPASRATIATAAAVAVLMAAVAWSPTLRPRTPQVQVPAIVAAPPSEVRSASRRIALPDPGLRLRTLERLPDELWSSDAGLLYEYSPLRARYSGASFARNGLD